MDAVLILPSLPSRLIRLPAYQAGSAPPARRIRASPTDGRGRREQPAGSHLLESAALTVFADPLARIFDDPDHSIDESRELIVGHSTRQRLLIVSFTQRGRAVRIVSARRATRRERHGYEQGTVVH